MAKVKVAINMTIEVDAEGWNMDYGTGTGAAAIRSDVKSAIHSLIHEYNDSLRVVKFS